MSTIPSVNSDPTNPRAAAAKGQRAATNNNQHTTAKQHLNNTRPTDTVELSEQAASGSNTPTRAERLETLKSEIADHAYPVDRYLDNAIDRMIDDAARWFAI